MTEQKAMIIAGSPIRPIVPTDLDGCWRLANAIVKARMAPKGLDTPEAVVVALLYGLELGLTPMSAVQSIAVVNGRPQVWGDGLIAICRASGVCEYISETFNDKDGDAFAAVCETQRKGEPHPVRRSFSIGDAKRAGLWGKAGPWTQYPKRMLSARARGFCLRDAYADFLRGVGYAEDHAGYVDMPESLPAPQGREDPPMPDEPDLPVEQAKSTGGGRKPAQKPAAEQKEAFDTDKLLTELDARLGEAPTPEIVDEIWTNLDIDAALTPEPEMLSVAQAMKETALKRIKKG